MKFVDFKQGSEVEGLLPSALPGLGLSGLRNISEKSMKILRCGYVVFLLLAFAGNAWADLAELEVGIEYPNDKVFNSTSNGSPVVLSPDGYNVAARADWWSVGGKLNETWANNQVGGVYTNPSLTKYFTVTTAGPASITFSLDGLLGVSGNNSYNNKYSLDAYSSVYEYDKNNNGGIIYAWTDEITTAIGEKSFSINPVTRSYNFQEGDVNSSFQIDLYLDVILHPKTDLNLSSGDNLNFSADYYSEGRGLRITKVTGGIINNDGVPLPVQPVPIPSTIWLLGTAIASLAGLRKKFRG